MSKNSSAARSSKPRILVLGGTAEARELARALEATGLDFVSSLAGRVSKPRLPVGKVRVGGFGGAHGLVTALTEGEFTHLVDATHPFAVGMRGNARWAAQWVGIPALRLARPGWAAHPLAHTWHWVETYADADRAAAALGSKPFITSGRQTLGSYEQLRSLPALVRVVEPPDDGTVPPTWTVVRDRGPFSVEEETALMREHHIDVLVTKDSGGSYTAAKLDAAARVGAPVVVVRRPTTPEGMPEVASPEDVLEWIAATDDADSAGQAT